MKNSQLTVEYMQSIVDNWIKTHGVRYFNELTNFTLLVEEVGELGRVMARKFGEQSFKDGEKDNIEEELADILFVLTCIANQTGISLSSAFEKSIKKKTKRDNERHKNNPKLK